MFHPTFVELLQCMKGPTGLSGMRPEPVLGRSVSNRYDDLAGRTKVGIQRLPYSLFQPNEADERLVGLDVCQRTHLPGVEEVVCQCIHLC